MNVNKIAENKYEIDGLPIRGFDWELERGTGAVYATYAGPEEWGGSDASWSWEENTPEGIEKLDRMNLFKLVAWVHKKILSDIEDPNFEERESL